MCRGMREACCHVAQIRSSNLLRKPTMIGKKRYQTMRRKEKKEVGGGGGDGHISSRRRRGIISIQTKWNGQNGQELTHHVNNCRVGSSNHHLGDGGREGGLLRLSRIATRSSRKRELISNHLPLLLHMGQTAYVNEGGIVAFELPIPVLRFYRGFPNAQVSADRFVFGEEPPKVIMTNNLT
jgi:hypothetical protein